MDTVVRGCYSSISPPDAGIKESDYESRTLRAQRRQTIDPRVALHPEAAQQGAAGRESPPSMAPRSTIGRMADCRRLPSLAGGTAKDRREFLWEARVAVGQNLPVVAGKPSRASRPAAGEVGIRSRDRNVSNPQAKPKGGPGTTNPGNTNLRGRAGGVGEHSPAPQVIDTLLLQTNM